MSHMCVFTKGTPERVDGRRRTCRRAEEGGPTGRDGEGPRQGLCQVLTGNVTATAAFIV